MSKERKVFTLEYHKLAKMGPDVVVIVPRKVIKYKVLDPEKVYHIHFEEVPLETQKIDESISP